MIDNAMDKIIEVIDAVNDYVGRCVAVLVLLMTLTAIGVVTLRYAFDTGFVWMQELYVWMHGLLFTLGAGYALRHDRHVRVDIFYAEISPRRKAWVNLLGTTFLLFPMIAVILWTSFPYVLDSWQRFETSYQAGGMKGLFILKTALLLFCLFLFIQGVALLLKNLREVRRGG